MNKARAKEIFVSVGFPVILGICVLAFAGWILSENCGLFGSHVSGSQMCHNRSALAGMRFFLSGRKNGIDCLADCRFRRRAFPASGNCLRDKGF